MWNRKDLKTRGKAAFKKNYWSCVLVSLILGLVTGSIAASSSTSSSQNAAELTQTMNSGSTDPALVLTIIGGALATLAIVGILVTLFLTNPITVGSYRFFFKNGEEEKPSLNLVLSAYKKGRFGRVFLTMFLEQLFIALWSLLLVIPGIIMSYAYRMVPYILADEPDLKPMEVIRKSRAMMKGQKWHAFVLDLSFIGWYLLTGLTCGILGIFYVNPYVQATNAELYRALKA